VVLNLCVNARDAMPEGGTLTVRAANVTLDPPTAATLPGSRAGSHVMIEIADTGTGIAPEILGKIWDPFFTTKGPGKGTGLGLATVRAIVSENGGTINLRSKVGEGSSFEIMLPAEPTMLGEAVSGTGADAPDGNGELILVVDDDAPVREVTCATLTQHGYRVIAAADGTEAVALAAPRNLEIRALITDIDLPNLDGTALTKVVAALNPSIRVILMSGSSSSGEDLRRRPPPHGRFLAKPFAGSVLLQTLHEVLAPAAVLAAPASGMTKFP
jgi:two-component system cell cycle sensor histidine kinase/response regulator CckA